MSHFIQCDVMKCKSTHALDDLRAAVYGPNALPVGWMIVDEYVQPEPPESQIYEAQIDVPGMGPREVRTAMRAYGGAEMMPVPKRRYMCEKHPKPSWKDEK